jgi:outer membrane protein OmpA-like peptidoglycan-associated protein
MKLISILAVSASVLLGQAPERPVYRVSKVERTIKAVTFTRGQASSLDLRGTDLAPDAKGTARIDARSGSVGIDINVQRMEAATRFGREYLTYVVWAITPEGRAENLGELQLKGNRSSLKASTGLQGFGLIVTAEPYFAVSQPSDTVVMEGVVGSGTRGVIQPVDAKFELLGRGEYVKMAPADSLPPITMDPRGVLQVYEAVNAVNIAKAAGAEKYAPDEFRRAQTELQNAQGFLGKGKDKRRAETAARSAVQTAEDARLLTLRKIDEERQANERAAAEAARQRSLEDSKRAAEAEAQRKTAEAQRQSADAARREAELAAQKAAAESERARQLKTEAEAARKEAEAARKEAEAARMSAEQERAAIRNQLRDQMNRVMATRESARGLIVDIGDVNFDTGKFDLKPNARERLARMAGILIATPGLKVTVEGHTDSVGSDEFNQRLSEQRANSVRQYLVDSGFPSDLISSRGFGKTRPVADNSTADGRQRNRRVEMIVSGERIGQQTID